MHETNQRFTQAEIDQIMFLYTWNARPISRICEQFNITRTQLHRWNKEYEETGTVRAKAQKGS